MRLEEKEALEAAEKLKDFCTGRNCLGCIFNVGYADCLKLCPFCRRKVQNREA